MRAFSFLVAFLFGAAFVHAQELSDKTLVKTLKADEATDVVIDFKSDEILSEPWDEGTFRIELTIESNMPTQILAQLVKAGRYSLEGYKKDGVYYVVAPNIAKHVSVRGKDLEEKITIQLKTPGYYALNENVLSPDQEIIAMSRGKFEAKVDEISIGTTSLKTSLKKDVTLELKTGDIVIDGQAIEIEMK